MRNRISDSRAGAAARASRTSHPAPAAAAGAGSGSRRRGPAARWCLALLLSASSASALGTAAPVPAGDRPGNAKDAVVGRHEVYAARYEDTLLDVARRFGIGIEEIKLANPGVDLWLPGEGTPIQLPLRFVLPAAPRSGLVINVPEMRIYYYPKGEPIVYTWPVGIGRVGWETPLGKTRIVRKATRPTWYPPDSIREEYAERGEFLPRVVRPGPDNPLGAHALYLGFPAYLIHGTNRPYSIGMRVSHGCLRMYPEHVAQLYEMAKSGTPVTLVHQRVKAGWMGQELYLEVHPDVDVPDEETRPTMTEAVQALITATGDGELPSYVDWKRVRSALNTADGVPVVVASRRTSPAPAGMAPAGGRRPSPSSATSSSTS